MEAVFQRQQSGRRWQPVAAAQHSQSYLAYKPEHYTEWFQRYAAIDPSLQACRTGNIFGVFYSLEYDAGGAELAGASIVLPESKEPAQ